MDRYLILCGGQALNFLLAVINIRACAKGKMMASVVSDSIFCIVNYAMIRVIAEAGNAGELAAYALGGALGSAIAIKVTRHWDAQ
jgi:hypothetical protein